MSRVGNKPIAIPQGVDISIQGAAVQVKGPRGELQWGLPSDIHAEVADGQVKVLRDNEEKQTRSMHGTARSIIANMIQGVHEGFSRELEISGVGYRAQIQGRNLVMNLGFSHPIEYEPPQGVQVEVTDNVKIKVSGIDKQQVGLASARIRGFCKAEPYKGKGIKYKGEQIRRKVGKTVA